MLSTAFSVIKDANLVDTNINNAVINIAINIEVMIFMNFRMKDFVDLNVVETKHIQVPAIKI